MRLKIIPWSVGVVFSVAGCANLGEPGGQQSWQLQPQLELRQGESVPQALYRLGRYHQGQLNYDRAIAAYREALDRDPAFVDAHNALGVVYSAQGRYDDAVRELRAAIALAPRLAYLHNNLGYVYMLRGSNELAIPAFQEAILLDPGQQRAPRNLKLAQNRIGAGTAAANAPVAVPPPVSAKAKDVIPPLKSGQDRRVSVRPIAPNIFQLQIPRASAVAVPRAPAVPATPATTQSASAQPMPMPIPMNSAASDVAPKPSAWPAVLQSVAAPTQRPALVPSPMSSTASGVAPKPAAGPEVLPSVTATPQRFHLEVSNGNGVNGLARRVAEHFKGTGLPRIRLTNQRPFNQPASEIQYRQGYAVEAAALRSRLQERVLVVKSERLSLNTDVRLVLGRDYRTDTALFMHHDGRVQVGLLAQ